MQFDRHYNSRVVFSDLSVIYNIDPSCRFGTDLKLKDLQNEFLRHCLEHPSVLDSLKTSMTRLGRSLYPDLSRAKHSGIIVFSCVSDLQVMGAGLCLFSSEARSIQGYMKVRERGNRKENCKITKMLLDVVTFSWKIILNRIKRHSVENVDKVI